MATEALDDRLRTTVYEPGSFVPLLRIDQDFSDTNPQELRDKRQLAAVGLLTPEAAGPIEDFLRTPPKQDIACYHTDHLGTPLRLTDTQGKTIWQAEPHDWAAVRDEHGETDQPIRFQGQWRDDESGLYYNRYRYYDPQMGRYVTQDPIGLTGGVNVYSYPTNPTIITDPLELALKYDTIDQNYHYYSTEGEICTVDNVCTMDSVAKANRQHPAPGTFSNTSEITNGQISNAQLGYKGGWDDFGPVVHSVSDDGLTITNTTLPGHTLYPGYVERTVLQRGDTIFIRTIGKGIGPMPGLNESLSAPLWNGLVDSHVRYRVNLGYRP